MNKLQFSLITLQLLGLICTLSGQGKSKNIEYFEGEIVYEIDYIPKTEDFNSLQLKQITGSTMVLLFKEGSHVKKYYNPEGQLLSERYVDLKSKKMYFKNAASDTVFLSSINTTDIPSEMTFLKDSIIDGYTCKRIEIKRKYSDVVNNTDVESKDYYVYAEQLPINPLWYSEFEASEMKRIMSYAKGLMIRSEEDVIYWIILKKIKTVHKRKVKKKELMMKLPHKGLLKQL